MNLEFKSPPSKTILLVEDDFTDAFFMQWAFRKVGLPNSVVVATTGAYAMNYLGGNGPFNDRQSFPLPSLIIINVSLRDLTGLTLVRWIRDNRTVSNLPVIALVPAHAYGAPDPAVPSGLNACFPKPADPDAFLSFAKYLNQSCIRGSWEGQPGARAA